MKTNYDIVVLGGGAAGFFSAIAIAQFDANLSVAILERGKEVLTKVKISGGGRCNVTHAEFMPSNLSQNYPRGEKELLGPFHSFMTGDTVQWFEDRGVALKIEEDGRMFPTTDSSQTIIDCFLSEIAKYNVSVIKGQAVRAILSSENGWQIETNLTTFSAKKIVVATGSNPKIWKLLNDLGHQVVAPVPSLFTFNILDERITELPGVSAEVTIRVLAENGKTLLESEGPLLITHWGMSGPAILKLSAWGARILEEMKYQCNIRVNWLRDIDEDDAISELKTLKLVHPKQTVYKYPQFELPKRLWRSLLHASQIPADRIWAEITKKETQQFAQQLTQATFKVDGKSTFKEEFVTAGGVDLKEVNFKTFESKIHKNMYFAGEVLNIDAITGGFNFQNAWTGGFMVAKAITS